MKCRRRRKVLTAEYCDTLGVRWIPCSRTPLLLLARGRSGQGNHFVLTLVPSYDSFIILINYSAHIIYKKLIIVNYKLPIHKNKIK